MIQKYIVFGSLHPILLKKTKYPSIYFIPFYVMRIFKWILELKITKQNLQIGSSSVDSKFTKFPKKSERNAPQMEPERPLCNRCFSWMNSWTDIHERVLQCRIACLRQWFQPPRCVRFFELSYAALELRSLNFSRVQYLIHANWITTLRSPLRYKSLNRPISRREWPWCGT